MKTTLKFTALSLIILAAFAFSGCESTSGDSEDGTHQMGGPKTSYRMSDRVMPDR